MANTSGRIHTTIWRHICNRHHAYRITYNFFNHNFSWYFIKQLRTLAMALLSLIHQWASDLDSTWCLQHESTPKPTKIRQSSTLLHDRLASNHFHDGNVTGLCEPAANNKTPNHQYSLTLSGLCHNANTIMFLILDFFLDQIGKKVLYLQRNTFYINNHLQKIPLKIDWIYKWVHSRIFL